MPQALYLKQLELGPMQNFVYLLGDPQTREAMVVDPGWEVPTILSTFQREGYRLTGVIATHGHFDHVLGLGDLLQAIDVPVYLNRAEAPALQVSPSNLKLLDDGDPIQIGELSVATLHTPGHTPGSQCLLVDGHLITGDTLFVHACGRCDLPGGDPRALYRSLERLKTLPDDTRVYPGHNYADTPTSTIRDEKQHNPFLRLPNADDFLALVGVPLQE